MTDLEQIKVLADPLRIRILESLCQERTTKQVAELLGERPTKLYHHVEALERVGLIRLSRTRRNRGTLEKYYLSVAKAFRADSSVFTAEPSRSRKEKKEGTETLQTMVATVFENTAEELRRLIAADTNPEEEGIVSYCEVQANEEDIGKLRRRLQRLLKDLQRGDMDEGDRRYRFTLAFFPLDRTKIGRASRRKPRL